MLLFTVTRDQWDEAYLRYRTAQMRRHAPRHYDVEVLGERAERGVGGS